MTGADTEDDKSNVTGGTNGRAESVPPAVLESNAPPKQPVVAPANPATMTAAEKKARREALRALMFNNKEREFVVR